MAERYARLRGVQPPTWALGLLVALLTFSVSFDNPGTGLDRSWGAGLYMAAHEGLSFGPDIVFTFGPLGFLFAPVLWFDGLAIVSFLYGVAIWAMTATALVWSVRRNLGALASVLISFVVLALFTAMEAALVISVIWSLAVLAPERPRWALESLIVGGALFAAIEILIKLSVGPVILAIMGLALIGARARLWQISLFAAVFAVSVTVIWLAIGGVPDDLVDYGVNGREVISGYSEALALPVGVGWHKAAAAGAALMLAAAAAIAPARDGRARWCGLAIAAIAGFAIYKEGVVRSEEVHMTVALATLVALWLAIPWNGRRRVVQIGGLAVIGVLALKVQPNVATERLNPIDNVRVAEAQAELLFSSERRELVRELRRAALRDYYGIEDRALAELRGRTVSVDPWEIAAAWAYELDWSPVPTMQNYQAYTEELDELNAARVADPEGPERILREDPGAIQGSDATRGLDNRYPAWEPPAQAVATLCNFEPLVTTTGWQVLGRVPDRCGEPQLIESVESAYGEEVPVPAAGPGEVVFARIHGAEVSGLEKLRALLYRARFRYAVVDGVSYRLVPGTARGGLLLDGAPELVGSGAWAQAPGAEMIELIGLEGHLRYDFHAMSVKAPGQAGTDRRRRD